MRSFSLLRFSVLYILLLLINLMVAPAPRSKVNDTHSRTSPRSQLAMPSARKSLLLSAQKHQHARIQSSPYLSCSDSSDEGSRASMHRRAPTKKKKVPTVSSPHHRIRSSMSVCSSSGGEERSRGSDLCTDDLEGRNDRPMREGTPSTVPCTSSSECDDGEHPPSLPSCPPFTSSAESVDSPSSKLTLLNINVSFMLIYEIC